MQTLTTLIKAIRSQTAIHRVRFAFWRGITPIHRTPLSSEHILGEVLMSRITSHKQTNVIVRSMETC